MLLTLATAAGLALTQQTDTAFGVERGSRLKVDNFGGEIAIRAWSESRIQIRATHSSRTRVDVSTSASVVSISTEGRRGPPQLTDLQITVPVWMAVSLSGVYTDMSIEGVQASVSAETVEGSVALRAGGSGSVTLQSVEGDVTITGARARIEARSVDGSVLIERTVGDIYAETVDGDITLQDVDAVSVEANTVDGTISYEGALKDAGRYRLATHDGDILIAVPQGANCAVTVSTYSGALESTFPIEVTGTRGKRISFTLGRGTGLVELESFDGDILLRRPGEPISRGSQRDRYKNKDHKED